MDPDTSYSGGPNTDGNRPSGGSGWIAFLVGGLVVAVAIIGLVMWTNGGSVPPPAASDVNVDINLPKPSLPTAPRMPELPSPPTVEPPTLPQPNPAPSN